MSSPDRPVDGPDLYGFVRAFQTLPRPLRVNTSLLFDARNDTLEIGLLQTAMRRSLCNCERQTSVR